MCKLFLLLVVGVTSFFALGATQLSRVSPVVTIVEGHLDHAPAGDTIRLYCGHQQTKAVVGPGGDFKLIVNGLSEASFASLAYARQRTALYLTPGDRLRLVLDFLYFETSLRYGGRGATANNYLAQSLSRFEYGHAGPRPQDQRTPVTTAPQMRQLADAFRQKRHAFLTTYGAAHPLPLAFQQQAGLEIDVEWARHLLDFPGYHREATQQAAEVPVGYYDFLQALPRRQLDEQVEWEPVLRLLAAYGGRLLPNGPLPADSAEVRRLYARATTDFGPSRARDWAMYQMLTFQAPTALLAAYPVFRTLNRDSTLSRNMRQLVQRELRMQPGQPAPTFTLLDQSGHAVSLHDFRGKVVYLDFWGTWCAPCRQELPARARLLQQFAGREVVFVSIAVNDAAATWQRVVATEHLAGPAQVALRSPDPTVAAAYNVQSFPTYLLIGRDGRIQLTAAPRPSSGPAVTEAIEHALQQ